MSMPRNRKCRALDREDVVLAKGNLSADRPRRGQGHDVIGGKLALGEGGQDLASDIAGRPTTATLKPISRPRGEDEDYGR